MPDNFEPAERGLRDHLAVWRRRVWVIALLTTLCGLAALATSLLQSPKYQSSAQVLVPVEPAGQPGQADAQTRFDPSRVVLTEAAFATGEQVQRAAEAKVGSDGTVVARGAKDSDIITITATAGSGERAAIVANAYASSYVELRQPPNGIEGVMVIEPAVAPGSPSSPLTLRNVVLGLALGLVLGIAGADAVDHHDDVIRDEDDLDRLVDLPVLGAVAAREAARVHVVEASDDSLTGTDVKALLADAPDAKVLMVPAGTHGHRARQTAEVLGNVGLPVVGAVLLTAEVADADAAGASGPDAASDA